MYNIIEKKINYCNELACGIDKLANVASKAYGTNGLIQYMSHTGEYKCTTSFKTVIVDGKFQDEEIQRATDVLRFTKIPEDGVKTAVILCNELVKQSLKSNNCTEKTYKSLDMIITFMQNYLKRIAKETDGVLPGGGLYLINLARPLTHYALKDHTENAVMAQLMVGVLSRPLLILAENAGARPHEVYERIKSIGPNQFFSLNHFGLEHSINYDDTYTDIFTMGFDVKDGKVKDLLSNDIIIPLEIGIEILNYLEEVLKTLYRITCII